jgi:hypothetical protein
VAAPAVIREQTEGLASGGLRDLAVKLAGDPALTVSVITHEDSSQELEVLRTGPPHHTEQTIDSGRFTRQRGQTLPMAEPPDVQGAVALVRAILLDDPGQPLPPAGPPVTAGPDVPQRAAQPGQQG